LITLNGASIGNSTFPNTEVAFKGLNKLIRLTEDNIVTVRYDHHEKTFEAFVMLASYLNDVIAHPERNLILEIPYLPYLRADRQVGDDPTMSNALLSVVGALCGRWKEIRIFDPHVDANTIRAGINTNANPYVGVKVCICYPTPMINYQLFEYESLRYTREHFYLVFPDCGARKRYEGLEYLLFHKPFDILLGEKIRDTQTGKIERISLDYDSQRIAESASPADKRALIIDDIVSYGGTATAIAQQLKEEYGFTRVIAWFSHTEHSYYKGKHIATPWIDKVYTTDSIMESHAYFTQGEEYHDKVKILPITPDLYHPIQSF
jgi:phosphoribosylpyrophosphate synthetase